MSITPLLQRRGSLLVRAERLNQPASSAGKVTFPPHVPRRKSFSQYQVLSPTVGVVMVQSRHLEALLAWADTEPEVVDVSVVNLAIAFTDRQKDRITRIPLRLEHADGSVSYWDASTASHGNQGPPACMLAKQEFAEAIGAKYRLFSWAFFMLHRTELLSRRAWQNILYSGFDVTASDIETQVLLALTAGPASVAELAAQIGAEGCITLLAVARQWRAGRIRFATRNALPGMELQVSLGGAYGR